MQKGGRVAVLGCNKTKPKPPKTMENTQDIAKLLERIEVLEGKVNNLETQLSHDHQDLEMLRETSIHDHEDLEKLKGRKEGGYIPTPTYSRPVGL